MDRREAMLRELNLYPQWVRRNQPAPVVAEQPVPEELQAVRPEPFDFAQDRPVEGHEAPIPVAHVGWVELAKPNDVSDLIDIGTSVDLSSTLTSSPSPASGRGNFINHSWDELKQQVRDCQLCKLRAGCTQTVFGVGDEKADWLFVGEGPGADEDAQGEPFVGQAGKLLDNMLLAIKLKRGKNVYIANIVKCRPPANRNPEADEITQCLPYLQRQIALIQPKLIVALGKTAATALLGKEATLSSLRGTLHDFNGIPLIVTYHPAYLLRSPMEKAKAWQDLCFAVNMIKTCHREASS